MKFKWPHYTPARMPWLHGNATLALANETTEERLLRRSERNRLGCLVWQGALWNGYGMITMPKSEGHRSRMRTASRVAYETWVGPIPKGMTLDHLCRNRACIEPTHLEIVTMAENTLRGQAPSAQNARKTHCIRGHALVEGNLVLSKLPARGCLTCKRDEYRRSKMAR